MATLRFYLGTDLLFDFRLRAGANTVGRADSCDVALPGEAISRTHCIIQRRGADWELIDRSRHGVVVDGYRVEQRATLVDGSVFRMGPYRVEVSLGGRDPRPTAPREVDHGHEQVLAADDGVHTENAVIHVVSGEDAGARHVLALSRLSVGASGSHVVIRDPGVVREHLWLRVARGRVMAEPGEGAVWLDGARVRAITPVQIGEELRVGDSLLRIEVDQLRASLSADHFGDMVGESDVMLNLFGTLRRLSGHPHTVLITGESGTGKELVARGIHEHSPRADRPFVALNCGAINPELFESELFGHERGAFTGADRQKDGAFHLADGGTLFLDELGELPESAQAKLLRVLETGEVRRVGGGDVSFPDVRILAATNRDLAIEVGESRFREDLFFRLAVLSVRIPPLRERVEDIPVLCRTLCRKIDPRSRVSPPAIEVLQRHPWPGNVRELRNVLTRAWVLHGPDIEADHLSFHRLGPPPAAQPEATQVRQNTDRSYIQEVLRRHKNNRTTAARELGIARSTLLYKMRKLGIE